MARAAQGRTLLIRRRVLDQARVLHPAEKLAQRDLCLGPAEGAADTVVDAAAEAEVFVVRPIRDEPGGVGEAARVVPGYGFVGASKAALESLVRTLAQELGPRGIRVNAVSAGVVDTDALQYFPNREALLASFGERSPAGPTLTPADVAGAVYLLCLPEAAMVNGHTLFVDGGFAISG